MYSISKHTYNCASVMCEDKIYWQRKQERILHQDCLQSLEVRHHEVKENLWIELLASTLCK